MVYEATQESTRRRVAVKVLRLGVRDTARRLRRFEREIELVAHLRHPLIVNVIDRGVTSEGRPYLVLEYVAGAPIAHHPEEPPQETLARFQRVCEAIQHAHQHGVVHRDIKPSNILVDENGLPRVLDFGLATTVELRESLALTHSREFLGTPIYAAPEQLRSGALHSDVRSDVYSLGVVLYELLTGRHPFEGCAGLAELVQSILDQSPPPPSGRDARLDDEVDTIVLRALEKDPDRRYPTVEALSADIGRYLRGEPIEAKRDSTWYTLRKTAQRHRWAVLGGTATLIMLTAFAIVMSLLYRRAADTSRRLALALAARDVSQGVQFARDENLVASEHLLWRQLLAGRSDGPIAAYARGAPLVRRAYWGLWELYQHQPCFATARIDRERPRRLIVQSANSIVATTSDARVIRWNPQTAEQTLLFSRPRGDEPVELTFADLQRDRVVVLDGYDLSIWELSSGRRISGWKLPKGPTSGRLSELNVVDGELVLASHEPDGVVRLRRVADGTILYEHGGVDLAPYHVLLDDRGRVWLSGPYDGKFLRIDMRSGERSISRERVWAGQLARAANGLYAHSWRIWRGDDEQLVAKLEDVSISRGRAWCFGASGRRLLGLGTTTPIWRTDDGKLVGVLASHDALKAAIGPDDRIVATAHADGSVRAWDLRASPMRRRLAVPDTAHCVRFDSDGRQLAIAGATPDDRDVLEVVDLSNPDRPILPATHIHRAIVSSAAFLPQSDRLVTGDYDGLLVLWRIGKHELTPLARASVPGEINALAVAPDGTRVAVACNDSVLWLWSPDDGAMRPLRGHAARVATVAWSHDGARLLSGSNDMRAYLWDLRGDDDPTPQEVGEFNGAVRTACFAPGGDYIALAGDDQSIQLWTADARRLVHRMRGRGVRIFALAISPDGALLASGDVGGGVTLWDTQTGAELANLTGHSDMVFSLDFSPDGRLLASGAKDGSVRLWDLHYFDRFLAGNRDYQRTLLAQSPDAP
ncbi:MAG: hypothetical protein D6744_18595 [Planctomycetota bacterium]|nr:MAG: hypothetical protein D6744_18595 [Planctomycetota bacterium]